MSTGDFWPTNIWTQFNGSPADKTQPGLLKTTMGPMQVAQHVFNVIVTGNDNSIPADIILPSGDPTTGETRTFATLRKKFELSPVHVNDPALTMPSNQVTLAAQALALAEDTLFFQGNDAPELAGKKKVDVSNKDKLQRGLLGIAEECITVKLVISPPGRHTYGLQTYSAVIDGIAKFTKNQQGPPYALILPPDIFADANLPLANQGLVTPSSAIQALLGSGQFVMSPGLPANTGLLASLGGKTTTTLYIGTGPLLEYTGYNGSFYSFTARESIQFHCIDSCSLIKLKFD
jgi:uncharacterized linocin/CFP29 family protein